MLDVVQHSVAVKACRAHRTASLHSALILLRLLSLDIRAGEAAWLYELRRGKDACRNCGKRACRRARQVRFATLSPSCNKRFSNQLYTSPRLFSTVQRTELCRSELSANYATHRSDPSRTLLSPMGWLCEDISALSIAYTITSVPECSEKLLNLISASDFCHRSARWKYHQHHLDGWLSTTVRFMRNFVSCTMGLYHVLPS
ncbi:hypothetical protein EVAR_63823_1 [Eumeta japonica]|uniref:Uncharacterized protein n=1 Tax=Eumeta variegata TaxID=151549 RepID=A0A4C1ZLD0_EUMVA|nr:hypothetical protein EVAR_63823_1 [Eumeta japonica]